MEMKKNRILIIILLVLVLLSLGLNVYVIAKVKSQTDAYTLYIGTNDKDSYQAEIPITDSLAKIKNLCGKYFSDFTVGLATGSWQDGKGKISSEKTIELIIYDEDIDSIHKLADDVIKELNQSTVLIVKSKAGVEYYDGSSSI